MKGCDVCSAKQRMRVSYGHKMLCSECYFEYRMIFEGILSNKALKKLEKKAKGSSEVPQD